MPLLDLQTLRFTRTRFQIFMIAWRKFKNPYVLADVARIREVLVNLLGNAVKFTKDGGKITLDISSYLGADEKHIITRYVVRDNGIGMSEEFQKKLFDPFSQEDDANARTQYKGTGLGMAITKNMWI